MLNKDQIHEIFMAHGFTNVAHGCAQYTYAMGEAASAYFETFKHAHPLPAQFRWNEVYDAMMSAAAQSVEQSDVSPIVAPYSNCSFRICDLPGQCRGEGKCHHPRALLATTPQADAAIAAGGAQEADVLEWLETEVSAVSCRYHGDPSYDHDAYWMKDRVMKLIADARKAFPLPRVAATVGMTDEQRKALEVAADALIERFAAPIRALLAASNREQA